MKDKKPLKSKLFLEVNKNIKHVWNSWIVLVTFLALQPANSTNLILEFQQRYDIFVHELILKNQELLLKSQNLESQNPQSQKAEILKIKTRLDLLEVSKMAGKFVSLSNENGKLFWQKESESQSKVHLENLQSQNLENLENYPKTQKFPLGFWIENLQKTEKKLDLSSTWTLISQNLAGESINGETLQQQKENYKKWKSQTLRPFWQEVDNKKPDFLTLSAVSIENQNGELDPEFMANFATRGYNVVFVPMKSEEFFFGNIIAYQNLEVGTKIEIIAKIPPEGVVLDSDPNVKILELVNKNKPLIYVNPIIKIQQMENGKLQTYFICTNYTSYFSDVKTRLAYIQQILELYSQNPKAKFLVIGDFNPSGADNNQLTNLASQAQEFAKNLGKSQVEIAQIQKMIAQTDLRYEANPLSFSSDNPTENFLLEMLNFQLDGSLTNLQTLAEYTNVDLDHSMTILEVSPSPEKITELRRVENLRKDASIWISLILNMQ